MGASGSNNTPVFMENAIADYVPGMLIKIEEIILNHNVDHVYTLHPVVMSTPGSKKVAIIGSGCGGLATAWALQSTDHQVHLFEKSSRLGGHTNTQTWKSRAGEVPVDTGFIVMNTATYPNFIRFLNHIQVPIRATSMTFGVSRDNGLFEWSGTAGGIFAQRRNAFNPRMWRMIFDIIRFNQFALDLLDDDGAQMRSDGHTSRCPDDVDMSIGSYLESQGYSTAFKDDYLIPMTAAVWSTSPDKASLDFPARTLVRFMWNHHLLSTLAARPDWLTIPGGSKQYIDAILKRADEKRFSVRTGCRVSRVVRENGRASVTFSEHGKDRTELYDHVVFACHGDEILPVLDAPTDEEKRILAAFQTTSNTAYLHSDLSLMPRRRAAWTAWNYLTSSTPSENSQSADVSLTYWMNLLQHIDEDTHGPVLVTMNPPHRPDEDKTQGRFEYRHPLYTATTVRAQTELQGLQNKSGISYAGAWTKYGFHEDGFSSGLKVATEHLGAELPFEFVDSTFSRRDRVLGLGDRTARAVITILQIVIWSVERAAGLPGVAFAVSVLAEAYGYCMARHDRRQKMHND